jgi:hypothetical protein
MTTYKNIKYIGNYEYEARTEHGMEIGCSASHLVDDDNAIAWDNGEVTTKQGKFLFKR